MPSGMCGKVRPARDSIGLKEGQVGARLNWGESPFYCAFHLFRRLSDNTQRLSGEGVHPFQ